MHLRQSLDSENRYIRKEFTWSQIHSITYGTLMILETPYDTRIACPRIAMHCYDPNHKYTVLHTALGLRLFSSTNLRSHCFSHFFNSISFSMAVCATKSPCQHSLCHPGRPLAQSVSLLQGNHKVSKKLKKNFTNCVNLIPEINHGQNSNNMADLRFIYKVAKCLTILCMYPPWLFLDSDSFCKTS